MVEILSKVIPLTLENLVVKELEGVQLAEECCPENRHFFAEQRDHLAPDKLLEKLLVELENHGAERCHCQVEQLAHLGFAEKFVK